VENTDHHSGDARSGFVTSPQLESYLSFQPARRILPRSGFRQAMSTVAAFRAPDVHPAKPLASWYMPGMIDGFGDRLVMVDNASSDALELLRFRPALRDTLGFEEALDQRVRQLRGLTHPAFPTVRGVEHLDGDGSLVLVSTSTPGQRLSQFLDERAPGKGLPPAFVIWIVSQTLEPISVLHAEGEDVAHAALTADRIILAPDGGVRVVEHVLGSALSHLDCSPGRLWQEFGILALCDDQGRPRLDGRGDIFQLGVVALSMLLARRISRADVDDRLPALLDEWSESSRSQLFHEQLRHWLERALQVGDTSYDSAAEALAGLRELPLRSASKAVELLQSGSAGPEATPEAARRFIPQSTSDAGGEGAQIGDGSLIEAVEASDSKLPNEPAVGAGAAITGPVEVSNRDAVKLPVSPRSRALRVAIGIALVAAVVAEGAVITTLLIRQMRAGASQAAAPSPGVPGLTGQASGQAPVGIADMAPSAQRPADGQGGAPGAAAAEDATAAAIARAVRNQRSGGVRLSTPIELKVLLGDRVLGSSADGPIVTSAGTYQLEFINTALGFRARRAVTFRAGEITNMAIPVPPGRINVNATPWAEVWIDSRALGETPLANVEVPLGEHELVFRHPDLGERRQRVVVRADAVTLASTTFDR
jgi:PEGA domain